MTAPARAKKAASRTGVGEQDAAKPKTKKARGRSAAAERAYARREERRDRSVREAPERRPRRQRQAAEQRQPRPLRLAAVRPKAKQLQAKVATSRVSLVVAGMGLLSVGLVATLWLSIATVGGTYRLQKGGEQVTALNERREVLLREVSNMDSTPALQRSAARLGMVAPPGPPAHLVVRPDGRVAVIGQPEAASAPAPPPPPPAPLVPVPPAPGPQSPVAKPPAPLPSAGQPPAGRPAPVASDRPTPDPQRQAAAVPAVEGR